MIALSRLLLVWMLAVSPVAGLMNHHGVGKLLCVDDAGRVTLEDHHGPDLLCASDGGEAVEPDGLEWADSQGGCNDYVLPGLHSDLTSLMRRASHFSGKPIAMPLPDVGELPGAFADGMASMAAGPQAIAISPHLSYLRTLILRH